MENMDMRERKETGMEMETSYESSCKRSSLALLSESEHAYWVLESDFMWAFICDFVHATDGYVSHAAEMLHWGFATGSSIECPGSSCYSL